MTVEVILNESEREEWSFHNFDENIVFTSYNRFEKPKGKRKFISIKFWDRLDKRRSNIPEPFLPIEIRQLAKQKYIESIKVLTFAEYKNN